MGRYKGFEEMIIEVDLNNDMIRIEGRPPIKVKNPHEFTAVLNALLDQLDLEGLFMSTNEIVLEEVSEDHRKGIGEW